MSTCTITILTKLCSNNSPTISCDISNSTTNSLMRDAKENIDRQKEILVRFGKLYQCYLTDPCKRFQLINLLHELRITADRHGIVLFPNLDSAKALANMISNRYPLDNKYMGLKIFSLFDNEIPPSIFKVIRETLFHGLIHTIEVFDSIAEHDLLMDHLREFESISYIIFAKKLLESVDMTSPIKDEVSEVKPNVYIPFLIRLLKLSEHYVKIAFEKYECGWDFLHTLSIVSCSVRILFSLLVVSQQANNWNYPGLSTIAADTLNEILRLLLTSSMFNKNLSLILTKNKSRFSRSAMKELHPNTIRGINLILEIFSMLDDIIFEQFVMQSKRTSKYSIWKEFLTRHPESLSKYHQTIHSFALQSYLSIPLPIEPIEDSTDHECDSITTYPLITPILLESSGQLIDLSTYIILIAMNEELDPFTKLPLKISKTVSGL